MRKIVPLFTFLLVLSLNPSISWGNDTGWYSVQPFDANLKNSSRTFEFSGEYAKEIKKLLPPEMAAIVMGKPSLQKSYEKNFRGLLLKDSQGNALFLQCSSAKLKYDEATKLNRVVPQDKTTCTVQMLPSSLAREFETTKVRVREALTKARQNN